MEFGVAFPSRVGDYKLVELAESVGFDQAWFFDSQMIYSPLNSIPSGQRQHCEAIELQ